MWESIAAIGVIIILAFIFLFKVMKHLSVSLKEFMTTCVFLAFLIFVFFLDDFGIANSIVITLGFNFFFVESMYNPKYADKLNLIDAKVKEYNKDDSNKRKISFNKDFFDRHNSIDKLIAIWLVVIPIVITMVITMVITDGEIIESAKKCNILNKIITLIGEFKSFLENLLNLDISLIHIRFCIFLFLAIISFIFLLNSPFMIKIPREIHRIRKEKYDIFELIDIEACDCIEGNNEKDFILKFKSEKNNLDEFQKSLQKIFLQEKNVHDFYNEIKEKHNKCYEHYMKNCTEEEFRQNCEIYYIFDKLSVYIGNYDDEEIKFMEECLNYNKVNKKKDKRKNKKKNKKISKKT
ncbi:MAG: hypothetical protein J6B75_07855 [Ruminococcus sp.]|nr:hypothetical protein [Ruminococcus sp.]